jgi:hypothetical protein
MSETDSAPPADPTAAAPVSAAPAEAAPIAPPPDPFPEVPPLNIERLPPNFRKHADPKSPVPLRGMAAKGMVPFSGSDMCLCLALLANDPDPGVAASARKILSGGLRDDLASPRVLHFFAEALLGKDASLEHIALNNAAHDATIALIAAHTGSARVLEIISNNQLRVLRSEAVLRAVVTNPAASKALVDLTCDFTVRNGLCLLDLPVMVEAYVRIHGVPPTPPPTLEQAAELNLPPPDTADAVMAEFGDALTSASAPPMEEGRRLNLTQRITKMNVSDKIKLATLGNKEARSLLIRDSNKLVSLAVVTSPQITDGEIMTLANSKTVSDDVLRVVYNSREWTRQYQIKLALVKNPKVPLAVALRLLGTLHETEIKRLANDKNVPSVLRVHAKKMTEKKV